MLWIILGIVLGIPLVTAVALWLFGERWRPLRRSTWKMIREGGLRRFLNIGNLLHGYFHGRWSNQYHKLLRNNIAPRLGSQGKKWLSDRIHLKVLTQDQAEAIIDRIAKKNELPLQVSTLKELGLAPKELGNPVKSGILCGVFFGLAALVPILPFAFSISSWEALTASIIGTVGTLFGVGAMKTIFSRKSWIWSGLKMMAIGASAAAITYVIGNLFSLII